MSNEYAWIDRWGQHMAYLPAEIAAAQEKAAAEEAPVNAIFRMNPDPSRPGIYATINEIENLAVLGALMRRFPETREEIAPLITKLSRNLDAETEAELQGRLS